MLTPYQYASDNPILFIDIDGLEGGKPASLTFNLFEVKNEWDNGPRVSAKINATVQLKVLDNTKIKIQQTLDYKSYLLSHEFTYNANGFDYQYMAYDQNGKPSPKTSNGAIQSQTLIGGSVDIKVVTTEIKSLDEIGSTDYVIILNDKVKGSNGEHLIGNTIGKVVLIGMDLLETDTDKRRKTTLHEIFHTFGPGDRGQRGVSDGTGNLMNANGEGVTLDATQASDVISKMVENEGAKKANDKRFNVDSKKRATDAVKDFTE